MANPILKITANNFMIKFVATLKAVTPPLPFVWNTMNPNIIPFAQKWQYETRNWETLN